LIKLHILARVRREARCRAHDTADVVVLRKDYESDSVV
jgi:hypothetical protein